MNRNPTRKICKFIYDLKEKSRNLKRNPAIEEVLTFTPCSGQCPVWNYFPLY